MGMPRSASGLKLMVFSSWFGSRQRSGEDEGKRQTGAGGEPPGLRVAAPVARPARRMDPHPSAQFSRARGILRRAENIRRREEMAREIFVRGACETTRPAEARLRAAAP